MSSQRFRLHRSVQVVAALTLTAVLLSPPATAAVVASGAPAPVHHLTVRPTSVEAHPGLPSAELRSTFQKDVDPWDDDLSGKKPPQSGVTASVRALILGFLEAWRTARTLSMP